MKELKPTKTCFYKQIFNQINLLLLLNICILFLSACTCNNSQPVQSPDPDPQKEDKRLDEAIVFIGTLSSGKSTMCNSIFQKNVFESGIGIGTTSLTPEVQSHTHEGKLYIDTPELISWDLTDPIQKAAAYNFLTEVDKIVNKEAKGFKLVLLINLVELNSNALKEFIKALYTSKNTLAYGIIFNQVTKKGLEKIKTDPSVKQDIQNILNKFIKLPSEIEFLELIEDMDSVSNMYFDKTSDNRQKLITFLDKLKVNKS
jgi:hypothetical protein